MSNADRPPIPSNPIESTITEENRDMQVPDASGKDTTYQVPMVSTGSSNVENDHDSHQDNANNSFDITITLPAQQDKTQASLSIQPVEDYTTWPARDEQLLHAVIQHIPFASTAGAGDSEQWDLVADTCNKGLEQLVNRIPPFVNGSKAKERFKILMAAHAALVHSDTQRVEFLPIYEQYERIRSLMEYCYSLYVKSGNKPDELLRKRKRDQDEDDELEDEYDDEREGHRKRMNESINTLKYNLVEMQNHTERSLKKMEAKQSYLFDDMNRRLSEKVEKDWRIADRYLDAGDRLEDLMKAHTRKVQNLLKESRQQAKSTIEKCSRMRASWSEGQQEEQARWDIMYDGLSTMRKNFLDMQLQMLEHHKRMEEKTMNAMRSLVKDSM